MQSEISSLLADYFVERRSREAKLTARIQELETRNSVLEDRLKRANRAQKDFLSTLDHLEKESKARRLRRSAEFGLFDVHMTGT